MLADEFPDMNPSPGTVGGTPVTLSLYVEDVYATFERPWPPGQFPFGLSPTSSTGTAAGCSRTPSGTAGTSPPTSKTSAPRRSPPDRRSCSHPAKLDDYSLYSPRHWAVCRRPDESRRGAAVVTCEASAVLCPPPDELGLREFNARSYAREQTNSQDPRSLCLASWSRHTRCLHGAWWPAQEERETTAIRHLRKGLRHSTVQAAAATPPHPAAAAVRGGSPPGPSPPHRCAPRR
jgi:hypothetical protein